MKRAAISMAALLISMGCASAQAPQAQDSAPPSAKGAAPGQMKGEGGSAKQMAPGKMKSGDMKSGDMKSGKTGEMKSGKMKDGSSTASDAPAQKKMKSSTKNDDGPSTKAGKQAADKDTMKNGMSGKKEAKGKGDQGGKRVDLKPEQKTKVVTTFKSHRVAPATNISVNISVGTAIPKRVKLYAIPSDILVIAPAYRGYRYFIFEDRVVIVEPSTYRIVDVLILA